MKKALLISVLSISLVIAAFFTIKVFFFNANSVIASAYIPQDSFMVVEVKNIQEKLQKKKGNLVLDYVLSNHQLGAVTKMKGFDSNVLNAFLKPDSKVYICYTVGEDSLFTPPTIICELSDNVLDQFGDQDKVLPLKVGSGKEINYVLKGNVLLLNRRKDFLLTYTKVEYKTQKWYAELKKEINKKEPLTKDDYVYINFPLLSKYDTQIKGLGAGSLAKHSFIAMDFEKQNLSFYGITDLDNVDVSKLSAFKGQKPQKVSLFPILSTRTSWLLHWGFDNAIKLEEGLEKYWYEHRTTFYKEREAYRNKYSKKIEAILSKLKNEIAFTNFSGINEEQLAYLKVTDASALQGVIELDNLSSGNNLPKIENYEGKLIYTLSDSKLLYNLFGFEFGSENFNSVFFYQNTLVFGSDISVLRNLINDIDRDLVWEKSILHQKRFENEISASNYGFFVVDNAFSSLYQNKLSKFKNSTHFLKDFSKMLEFFSLQLSYENQTNTFFTSGQLAIAKNTRIDERQPVEVDIQKIDSVAQVNLENGMIKGPWVVNNYKDDKKRIIFQNNKLELECFTSLGKKDWSYQLSDTIIGEVFEVDLFKNNKIQYVFALANSIVCLDRLGKKVDDLKSPNFHDSLKYFSVIDYDGSKKYRFASVHSDDKITLSDSKGKKLGAWNPLDLKKKLAGPLHHCRVSGKDYLIVKTQKGGYLQLQRNGTIFENFELEGEDDYNLVMKSNGKDFEYWSLKDSGEIVIRDKYSKMNETKYAYLPDSASYYLSQVGDETNLVIVEPNLIRVLSSNLINKNNVSIDSPKNEIGLLSVKDGLYMSVLSNNKVDFVNAKGEKQTIRGKSKSVVMYEQSQNVIALLNKGQKLLFLQLNF